MPCASFSKAGAAPVHPSALSGDPRACGWYPQWTFQTGTSCTNGGRRKADSPRHEQPRICNLEGGAQTRRGGRCSPVWKGRAGTLGCPNVLNRGVHPCGGAPQGFRPPARLDEAIQAMESIMKGPSMVLLSPGERYLGLFSKALTEARGHGQARLRCRDPRCLQRAWGSHALFP